MLLHCAVILLHCDWLLLHCAESYCVIVLLRYPSTLSLCCCVTALCRELLHCSVSLVTVLLYLCSVIVLYHVELLW